MGRGRNIGNIVKRIKTYKISIQSLPNLAIPRNSGQKYWSGFIKILN